MRLLGAAPVLCDQTTHGRNEFDRDLHQGFPGSLQRSLVLSHRSLVGLALIVFEDALNPSFVPALGEYTLFGHGFLLRRRMRASLALGPIS